MSPSREHFVNLQRLRDMLQEMSPREFERLLATVLGDVMEVPLFVAGTGFQHGGDAGPAGRAGRHLRIECKRYSGATRLSERELLGEIDQALIRDPELEAWLLVSTTDVPEQLAQSLIRHGNGLGVPVLVLEWSSSGAGFLPALCAACPHVVEHLVSTEAGMLARSLAGPLSKDVVALRRDLQLWCIGFESLRSKSHSVLLDVWKNPKESNARLGQDVAGGSSNKRIDRHTLDTALNAWWSDSLAADAPALVVGRDGVGKTWAAITWLVASLDRQPIVAVIPSSAVGEAIDGSQSGLLTLIARALYEIERVRDHQYWARRVERMLARPSEEGPVLTVVFDGINQQPSAPWIRLLQILQGPVFGGRVRVVLTSREHFVHDRMGSFRRLSPPPTVVRVDIYDDAPGGEFDQVLALEGLRRSDLRPDLLELARTPRLFKLVTLLRHRLGDVQAVTVPRLLWEYGRDSLGVRAGAEFGEVDWQEWVRDVARTCRSGMPRFSTRELSDSASRSDLSPEAIYRRLSELVDGHFVRQSRSGDWEPSQPFVSLALAVTLTAHLEDMAEQSPQAIAAALAEWLEPISGMDQRADVLRAASTIAVARGASCSAALRSELVVAWVLSHNLPEEHLSELLSIVRGEPDLLLDIAEGTRSDDRTPARKWALRTLRTASTADHRVQRAIVNRVAAWCRRISRGVDRVRSLDAQYAEARLKQLGSRVGSTAVGPRDILSVRCTLVDDPDRLLMSYAPSLLESCPLDECGPVFEAAAIELAVRGECDQWEELKWLCWFNERRPDQAATMLRHLAADIRRRTPEPGVHPQLPEAVASNLLLLSGVETDERLAAGITPDFARPFNYATDYEADPARSMFALERRHAVAVLGKSDIPLHARVQRLGDLWYDPTFLPPASFATELVDAVSSLALNNVDCHNGVTSEDHWLETVEPALARVAPDALATLAQKVFQQSLAQPKANAYWRAVRAAEPLVLVDQTAVSVAASLRDGGFGMSDGSELHAATELLLLELVQLGAREQHRRLVLSNLPAIYTRFEHILKPLTEEDVDALISEFRFGSPKQHQDLLDLLSLQNVPLSEVAWMWLSEQKDHQNPNVRGRVFQHLADSNAVRFGAILRESGWSWDQGSHLFVNHYGSVALIAASMGLAFDLIAPRLAPWKVLFAARQRGEKSEEVRLAAAILDHVLMRPSGDGSDPGVELEVHCTDLQSPSILVSVATPDGEGDNPIAALEAALNPEARQQAYQRALRAAVKHIQRTQRSGHSLYLINYQQADMDVVARIAPDVVDRWLRGMEECTPEFRERVWLAERVYLALAASLLQHNPARGVAAWRALRVALRTRYIGEAGIDELIHMVFQAAESEDVAHLRRELLDPSSCNTDQDLQDIAIAAMLHGKREWLESVMREDAASNVVWRQRRAVVLEGYTTGHTLPVERAWPRCGLATSYERLAQRAACRKSNDACARHWWRQYIGAETPAAAYAAWVLFTRSADRRRRLWMTADSREARKSKEIPHLTSAHLELNSEKLKRAVAKRERNREKQFLGRDISKHIKPWRSDD